MGARATPATPRSPRSFEVAASASRATRAPTCSPPCSDRWRCWPNGLGRTRSATEREGPLAASGSRGHFGPLCGTSSAGGRAVGHRHDGRLRRATSRRNLGFAGVLGRAIATLRGEALDRCHGSTCDDRSQHRRQPGRPSRGQRRRCACGALSCTSAFGEGDAKSATHATGAEAVPASPSATFAKPALIDRTLARAVL